MGTALLPGLARRDPSAGLPRRHRFDLVASLGMFEHVGYKNYRKFFEVARRGCVLAASFISLPSGPTALRVPPILGSTNTFFRIRICRQPRKLRQGWRACLSLKIGRTGPATTTARLWLGFRTFKSTGETCNGERFYRMWKYYLMVAAACFRSRKNQVWQILLAPQ